MLTEEFKEVINKKLDRKFNKKWQKLDNVQCH